MFRKYCASEKYIPPDDHLFFLKNMTFLKTSYRQKAIVFSENVTFFEYFKAPEGHRMFLKLVLFENYTSPKNLPFLDKIISNFGQISSFLPVKSAYLLILRIFQRFQSQKAEIRKNFTYSKSEYPNFKTRIIFVIQSRDLQFFFGFEIWKLANFSCFQKQEI